MSTPPPHQKCNEEIKKVVDAFIDMDFFQITANSISYFNNIFIFNQFMFTLTLTITNYEKVAMVTKYVILTK